MRLLLDTHIWVWSVGDPQRLSRRVTRELEKESNELWLSPISTWELVLLAERGRLGMNQDPAAWIEAAFEKRSFNEAPVTHEVVLESRNVVLPHRDPADRFLAATARHYELTLVTADPQLLRGKGFATLPNR